MQEAIAPDVARLNDLPARTNGKTPPSPMPIAELVRRHPKLRPSVVDGLLREGETAGIHAKSKMGKSWLVYGLSLSVAAGLKWLGTFQCVQGRVLLLDFELHPECLAERITRVARAMQLGPADYGHALDVLPLRGRLQSIDDLAPFLQSIKSGQYSLVICDPLYRLIPRGVNENDNSAMAHVFNAVDRHAGSTGAAFLLIHHQSKGDQSGKDLVDIGSGAGSIARAVDSHIVLRPHEASGCVVMESALRSFGPADPLVLKWDFPLWKPAEGLDPSALKRPKSRGDQRQEQRDKDGREAVCAALSDGPASKRALRSRAGGMGKDRLDRILHQLVEAKAIDVVVHDDGERVQLAGWSGGMDHVDQ